MWLQLEDLDMAEKKYKQGPFLDAEVELIRRLFPKAETIEIAARLNRSNNSVRAKLRELGLRRQPEIIWSRQETALLKKLYPTTSTWALANQLGFKSFQVRRKARELDLKKK
jgi:hypothetical protein